MKRLLLLTVLLGFSITATSQTKSKNYPESGFSVTFPKEPTVDKQTIDSEVGKIDMTIYQCPTDAYMAMISENKFPETMTSKLDKDSIDKLLDDSKNGALKNIATQMGLELKIISNEKFLFNNKYQAIKCIGKIANYDMTAIYIMKSGQLFQLLAMGDLSGKEVDEFFKSFSIIE